MRRAPASAAIPTAASAACPARPGLNIDPGAHLLPADAYLDCLQLLLRLAPKIIVAAEGSTCWPGRVRDEQVARASSGVIMDGPHAQSFEAYLWPSQRLAAVHWRPGEWWSDHFDSPLFLILAVGDHAAATGDEILARRHCLKAVYVFRRYTALRGPDGLPVKQPPNDRDWADNVFVDLVLYDLGLWVEALDVLARASAGLDPPSPPRRGRRRSAPRRRSTLARGATR